MDIIKLKESTKAIFLSHRARLDIPARESWKAPSCDLIDGYFISIVKENKKKVCDLSHGFGL